MSEAMRLLLEWAAQDGRTHAEGSKRWGMYWDEALYAGWVEHVDQRIEVIDGYRHLITSVRITDAGRDALAKRGRAI